MRVLNKKKDKMYTELQQIILNDIGRGSIFENIVKINEGLMQRLKVRVDL